MRAEEFSRNILDLDDRIRFAAVMERSGHIHGRCTKEGFEEYLKAKDQEISFSQTAYIVEMREIFERPRRSEIYSVFIS